ncbi:PREDICTED: uncharacterized protein At4g19900-like [Tarenaya hassleriana]|uniref:uncharacterized protein At4g19900-like n=1 Tax=Tarenaya hassleriana TaxID=28532 RepID=UPI00053CA84C|nr:PREDICTED: uncharacterized protein At4g19900-like [Tarenaya hassleriana]
MRVVTKRFWILSNVKPRKMPRKSLTLTHQFSTTSYGVVTILVFSAILYLVYSDFRSDISSFSGPYSGPVKILPDISPKSGTNANSSIGPMANSYSLQKTRGKEENEDEDEEVDPLIPPLNASKEERIIWFREKLPELEILNSTSKSRRFHGRVLDFFKNNCSAQFFMVWLSPAKTFGPRDFLAIDTLFSTNPDACLVILSHTLDSPKGYNILKPFLDRDFQVLAVTPDVPFLVQNTPAESWLKRLKSGTMDPGSIPLFMNLSDLTRLAVLYKYGGIYLDTDIVFLNDLTGLRNAIGAQSVHRVTGRWTRLNNAVMIFDIYHPLLFEFLKEYATNFDGNRWGYNSPYLVSRVIERLGNKPEYNLTIFPPDAFYSVNWIKIPRLFKNPASTDEVGWVEKTVNNMSSHSYMIHLWNKVTRQMEIEEGSVMHRLISTHCTICQNITNSHV